MLLIVSNHSDGKDINNKNKNSQHMLRVAGRVGNDCLSVE